jgi:hypothetical protein
MNEKQYHSEDQINFIGLKNFVYAFLQEFFKFVEFTQLVIRRKLVYIIIGAVLGVLVGVYYWYNKKQVYTASMTVIFNRLNARTYGAVLDDLNTLLATGASDKLAEQLQIPANVASNIIVIDGKNMNSRPLLTDTTNRTFQLFRINVVTVNDISLDTFQTGLLNYFKNLPYLKNMVAVEKQFLSDRIRIVESDLAKLDTLKTEMNRFLASSKVSSTVYSNAINPAEIYEQTTLLLKERENALRLLNIEHNPVSLVDGLKLVKAPRSRPLPDLLLILGSIGLLTGFLFGLLLETKKQVLPGK